ncbi:WD40-repeat-containing domain protein [Armillaria luteobubalina]|uniref:WD40-repeat-containing domain protein n=1 Tax=Armillaria luteobubalina TaxID=153913 RepID=A0AA39QLH8_9AGAR|nr:WD40-repeat-containing domain protein [Armillaria luteobubalina]
MSQLWYTCLTTIEGKHKNSINILAFSKDGKFFTSGCEDGVLSIFNTKSGAEFRITRKFFYMWEQGRGDSIVTMSLRRRLGLSNRVRDRVAQLEGPIRCMEFDSGTEHLIVGHGYKAITYWKLSSPADWHYAFRFTYPAFPTPANFIRPMPHPTGIHIPHQNNRVLVMFLDHSIVCYSLERGDVLWSIPLERRIGWSAVSTDGMVMVMTNLFDGIDVYSLASNTLQHTANIPDDILDNVVIPICLINQDKAIFVGGSDGTASIVDLDMGKILCTLHHSHINDLAYTELDGTKYLVTGDSEKGDQCCIKIWVGMSPGSQRNKWFKKLHIKDVAFQALTWPLFIIAASFMATVIWMVSIWLQSYLSRVPALWAWCSAAFVSVFSSFTGVFSGAGSPTSTVVYVETITHTPPFKAATTLMMPPAVTETVMIFNDRYFGEKRESSDELERLARAVDGSQEGEYEYTRNL